MLEIRTFGGLCLGLNGKTIKNIGSHKAEALLVYLAVEAKPHRRNELTSLLWPETPEENAATSLRVVLSILRKRFKDYLDITRETVRLRSEIGIYLDLSDLEGKLASGQIMQALKIYRGEFLQGQQIHESASFEEWLRFEQEHVRRLVVGALQKSISKFVEEEDYVSGHILVDRWLELEPLDEEAFRQSILLFGIEGKRTAALSAYKKCCDILHEELEVEPSKETQDLYRQVLADEKLEFTKPSIIGGWCPASTTSFIGRGKELIQIATLNRDPSCRLLTLMGPGGCGKTRLALRVAQDAAPYFSDGVYFVPVEAIPATNHLISVIAEALHFHIDTFYTDLDPKIQLLDFLSKRSILLILDSFENLIADTSLLTEMLDHAPKLRIWVTSRQKLNLNCEWTFPVEGLPIPQTLEESTPDGSEAVRLFDERARQARRDFLLTKADREPVSRICRFVEGMPLGIELAAAWSSLLSPREIAIELERNLDFLDTTMPDIPEKHRSLRSIFNSAWLLLSNEQHAMLSSLSIFQDRFDREAARQVAGVNLKDLFAFVNKSLVKREEGGWFRMHNIVHQFAEEKLNQYVALAESVRERFSRYYLGQLMQLESDLMGPRMYQARDTIRQDIENVHAAVLWAGINMDPFVSRRILNTLLWFYAVQGWHEGKDAFGEIARLRSEALRARGVDPEHDPVVLSARTHQAFYLGELGRNDESEKISRECLKPLRDLDLKEELSECLHNLGLNAMFRGEYNLALDLLESAISLGRETNHLIWYAYLLWLGHTYFLRGEYDRGLQSLQKCHDLFSRSGNDWGIAFALDKMAMAADALEDHVQAMRYHREALTIFERTDNRAGKGYCLSRMSMSTYFLEEYRESVKFGQEGYAIFSEIGHRWGMGVSKCRLGFAFLGTGNPDLAREQFMKALQQSQQDRMLPLSLYALAGLASIYSIAGDQQVAMAIFHYVQRHPRTPSAYLEQAGRWIRDLHASSQPALVDPIFSETDPVDKVVDFLLNHPK